MLLILGHTHIENSFADSLPQKGQKRIFTIAGADRSQLNPASINLRIGTTFLIPKRRFFGGIRLGSEMQYSRVEIKPGEVFHLRPHQFVLATTLEMVSLTSDISAFVQGRSSIGRAGLSVQNAGFVDPGFRGAITLELKNETWNTIDIPVGYPVTQLVFMATDGVTIPYHGKYMDQQEATGSRMQLDKNKGF